MNARYMVLLVLLTMSAFVSAATIPMPDPGTMATAPMDPNVDFRDELIWGDAGGLPEYTTTYYGYSITVKALPPSANNVLYRDNDDGFGVDNDHTGTDKEVHSDVYEPDEIEKEERLLITFNDGPVLLSAIFFSDLFTESYESTAKKKGEIEFDEAGSFLVKPDNDRYEFDSRLPVPDGGDEDNGEHVYVLPEPIWVTSIKFRALARHNIGNGENHEYSVLGLNIEDHVIPEPATWLLLIVGSMFMLRRFGKRTA
jgi:hypothetical protein